MIRNYLYKCPECSGEYVRQEKPEGVRWCAYCKALITLKFVEQLSKEEMEGRIPTAVATSPEPGQEPVPEEEPVPEPEEENIFDKYGQIEQEPVPVPEPEQEPVPEPEQEPEEEPVPAKGPFTFKCAECGMIHTLDTIPDHKITCSGCYHTITLDMLVE